MTTTTTLPTHLAYRIDAAARCNMLPATVPTRTTLLCMGISVRGMSEEREREIHDAARAYIASLAEQRAEPRSIYGKTYWA